MKNVIKALSVILAIVFIFASCSTRSSEKSAEQINVLLAENKYNDCKEYIEKLDSEVKSQINGKALKSIIEKYKELFEQEKINLYKIYDLSLYSKDFTEKCRSLWNMAEQFQIEKENENYTDFIYLHYFAEVNDMVRYREVYALFKATEKSGYLETLTKTLYSYDKSRASKEFEQSLTAAKAFDYSNFDPGQYMIADFRETHDKIVASLQKALKGFSADDTEMSAEAVNDLYDCMTVIIRMADAVTAVYAKELSILSSLKSGDIYADFDTKIVMSTRQYEPGMSLSLDTVFGSVSEITNNKENATSSPDTEQMPKEKAVEIAVNAINASKRFAGDVSVKLTENRSIRITGLDMDTDIQPTIDITKTKISAALRHINGTKANTYTFKDGINGEETLDSFIPPAGKSAALNASAVTAYKAVKGSGGYVITLTVAAETDSKSEPAVNISSIINCTVFDNMDTYEDYTTYYAPTIITVTVNNDGLLSKLQYTINGVSKCNFTDSSGIKAISEFAFDREFTYEIKY